MREVRAYYNYVVDGNSIIILGDEYRGNPLICYSPNILIASQYILNKYSECFMFDKEKTKIIVINP